MIHRSVCLSIYDTVTGMLLELRKPLFYQLDDAYSLTVAFPPLRMLFPTRSWHSQITKVWDMQTCLAPGERLLMKEAKLLFSSKAQMGLLCLSYLINKTSLLLFLSFPLWTGILYYNLPGAFWTESLGCLLINNNYLWIETGKWWHSHDQF